MSASFPSFERSSNRWQAVPLSELPRDFKRMLSIQFREFIHHIEDVQQESDLEHNPRVISFLERCYRDAA